MSVETGARASAWRRCSTDSVLLLARASGRARVGAEVKAVGGSVFSETRTFQRCTRFSRPRPWRPWPSETSPRPLFPMVPRALVPRAPWPPTARAVKSTRVVRRVLKGCAHWPRRRAPAAPPRPPRIFGVRQNLVFWATPTTFAACGGVKGRPRRHPCKPRARFAEQLRDASNEPRGAHAAYAGAPDISVA